MLELTEFGYTVIETCDGEEAVMKFREGEVCRSRFHRRHLAAEAWEVLAEIRGIRPVCRPHERFFAGVSCRQ